MTIGTSGVQRLALLLETTGHSSFAYASSSASTASFDMSTAQNTKSTCAAIAALSASASITTRSLYFSGNGVSIAQRLRAASS